MKPSWGLRIITFGLPVVAFFVISRTYATHEIAVASIDYWALGIVIGLMVYSALFIGIYELRYDNFRLAHRDWRFVRREMRWDDLLFVRDGGGYYFVLQGQTAGRFYVPKHLTGIEDFLGMAEVKIAENERP